MKSKFSKMISLLLVVVLAISELAACSVSNVGTTDEEAAASVTATAVRFSSSGKYTTTILSDKVDLSGVTVENTDVIYTVYDPTEEQESEDESAEVTDSSEESEPEGEDEPTDRYTYSKGEKKAAIDEIKANGKGWDITFTDEYAAEYTPETYIITFRDLDEEAYVNVEYPSVSLSSDVQEVNASSTATKVTLTIEGGEFKDDVSADDVELGKAFEKMNIESISASGLNLTMQLSGSPVKNEQLNIQESGTVTVKSSAVKDGYCDLSADIAVQTQAVYFDSSTFTCKDGKVTAELVAYDSVDVASLTKDNVVIDGITVEAVEKKDDHTAVVTVKADSGNDFAEKANGGKMTLNGYETEITVAQASFYPVFDYCEAVGDDLKLTLIAYASSGTFDKGISADALSFGRDFEGAKVESVERESDVTAKLVISVPANGQTAETLNMTGEITLAAGSLLNNWGEKQATAQVSSRVYSGETLGKASNKIVLTQGALLEIQKYTRGRNTLFGEICYWGGNAGTVFSLVKSGLEIIGVLESDQAAILREFKQINAKLDQMQDTLNMHTLQLEQIDKHLYEQDVDKFRSALESMLANYKDLTNLYKNARDDYAPELYIKGEDLPKKMKAEGAEPKALIDWENATDKECAAYCDALTDICLEGSDNRNSRYYGFTTKRDALVTDFHTVVNQLTKHDVFGAFDTFASYEYNFDTQAYYVRCAYRENALASLEKVMALLHIIYKTDSDPYNYVFEGLNDEFLAAVDAINNHAVTSLAPEDVDVVPRTVKVTKTVEYVGYIGEVKLSADKNKDKAKKALTDEGYTIIHKDLNESAGGDYIYLGYKKTDKYEDAIKNITLLWGKSENKDSVTIEGVTYTAVPANFNRDLNKGAGGDYIYMFYTKTERADKTALQDITFDNVQAGSVRGKDLNDNAGGAYIYMHLNRYKPGLTVEVSEQRGSDPAYHPYCYSLGRKVRIGTSKGDKEYFNWKGALVSSGSQRAFTDVEYTKFMQRIKANTIKGEFADAGIKLTYPLLMSLSYKTGSEAVSGAKQHKTYTYYNMSGNVIKLDSIEITKDVKFAKLFSNTKRRFRNERYQEFNYLFLD